LRLIHYPFDYSMEDWISIIIGEGGRDSLSILISSLWVVGSNEAEGGIEGATSGKCRRVVHTDPL